MHLPGWQLRLGHGLARPPFGSAVPMLPRVYTGLPNNLVRRGVVVPFHALLERVFNRTFNVAQSHISVAQAT